MEICACSSAKRSLSCLAAARRAGAPKVETATLTNASPKDSRSRGNGRFLQLAQHARRVDGVAGDDARDRGDVAEPLLLHEQQDAAAALELCAQALSGEAPLFGHIALNERRARAVDAPLVDDPVDRPA